MIDLPEKEHWYALRIFHNKIGTIKARIDRCGFQSYIPMRTVERIAEGRLKHVAEPVIPSLLFIRTPREYVEAIRKDPASYASVYCFPGTSTPAEISDHEMEIFMFVTKVGSDRLETVDLALAKGDRIRVTAGIFKGAEGYIARVHNAKRLIVVIEGVAAIATTYIPKSYIEKISL
ncbi:MAG: UpxY family transcription antiterminator [Alistipes sp.]|jgi:hypothetical protein|uniref:UpxY family transcription antiterminator n=1 Tax=Alistipes TaxID=239759 RepID=UPI0022E4380F|nr:MULTISPECIES: UpxY family transcription antiterminator [Alistipes]MBS5554801.1 UpxY family transcription antiterminator [Alistipes sp.]